MKFNLFIVFIILIYLISEGGEPKADTKGGLAIHIGYGSIYGRYGIGCEYQFVLKKRVRATPSICLGFFEDLRHWTLGYSIGGEIEFGYDHRAFIGARFGTINDEIRISYNDSTDELTVQYYNSALGPTIEAGYKGEVFFGLLWFVRAGAGVVINGRVHEKYYPVPVFSTGLGWKF